MATIREYVTALNVDYLSKRLSALQAINAPSLVIDSAQNALLNWRDGKIKISGDVALLDAVYEAVETRKGNGGREYFVFDNAIAYFPKARFGHYIKVLQA